MSFGTGHGGAYEPTSLTLPLPTQADPKVFFASGVTTAETYAEAVLFNMNAIFIEMLNTGINSVEFSYDGVTTHGVIPAGDTLVLEFVFLSKMFFQDGDGTTTVDIRARAY